MTQDKKSNKKKDSFHALLSFYLSLGFWIPLFNIGIVIVSIWFAISALKKINKNPNHYGGLWFSIIALILSSSSLVTTLIFILIYSWRKITCASLIV